MAGKYTQSCTHGSQELKRNHKGYMKCMLCKREEESRRRQDMRNRIMVRKHKLGLV